MNTTGHHAASHSASAAPVVSVRGALTTAPKTTYDSVDAGWVEMSWSGGVVRTTVRICDRGRGVADYWWGHTFPTISREGLPFRLWDAVCEYLKGRGPRVGEFEATVAVPGLEVVTAALAA